MLILLKFNPEAKFTMFCLHHLRFSPKSDVLAREQEQFYSILSYFLDFIHREWRFTARCKTHCHLQIRKLVEKMLNLSQNVWKFAKKLLCFDSRTIGFLNTDTRGLFCNWRFNWEDYGENCYYLYFKILRYYAEMFCVFMSKFMVY